MEAGWRADWRGVPDLAGWGDSWACTPRGGHVCPEDCFRQHDVKCEERPPVDGGRNPEEVVEALEPSHWRETPSTPIPAENDMAHLVADFVHTWRLQAAWRYFARGVLRRR